MAPQSPAPPSRPADGIVPAYLYSIDALTTLANTAFADYLVPFVPLLPEQFARMVATQGIDLSLSRLFLGEQGPVGFGFVNRTAGIARLTAMAFLPPFRGQGYGGKLLARLIEESRTRGETLMTLEVFEQNPRALALYRRHGFRETTRLFGWRLPGPSAFSPEPDPPVAEIPLLAAARWAGDLDYPAIPWQTSRHAIARLPAGARAFASGSACAVIGDPAAEPIQIAALLYPDQSPTGWETLRRLLAAVTRRFPNSTWFAPQKHPEPTDREVFAPLGFRREPLNQFLMLREGS